MSTAIISMEDTEVFLTRAEVSILCKVTIRTLGYHQEKGYIAFTGGRISLAKFNRYVAKYQPKARPMSVDELYAWRQNGNINE